MAALRRLTTVLVAVGWCGAVWAETPTVVIAQQYDPASTPLMFMERFNLVEKHAAALGLSEPKVSWIKLNEPSAINDGLLSGSLSFAPTSAPALALLWDRTKGGVRGLGMLCSYRLYLNTRNPAVKTIGDFTSKDRIAVDSAKVSLQVIHTQMEAEKHYGTQNYDKLDSITVPLSHPEATASLLNDRSEITAHYAPSPFHEQEIADPRIHTVMDVKTAAFLIGTEKFRRENPLTHKAILLALMDAIVMVNADPGQAVAVYREMAKDKTPADELRRHMFNPRFTFSLAPDATEEIALFMARIGTIKATVVSWKDLFFPEVHGLPGS